MEDEQGKVHRIIQVCEPGETKFVVPAAVVITFLASIVMIIVTASFIYTREVRATLETQVIQHKQEVDGSLKEIREDVKKILMIVGSNQKTP